MTDRKNGDFDTVGIFYAIKPYGEKVEINRFFKESEDGWKEIDEAEYIKRMSIYRPKYIFSIKTNDI